MRAVAAPPIDVPYISPENYRSASARDLIEAVDSGFIGFDRRLALALVEKPIDELARFALNRGESLDEQTRTLLTDVFRHTKNLAALPALLSFVRLNPDAPDELAEAIVQFGAAALEPLLALYEELGEEAGSGVAFMLAGLGVRDDRILHILLERLEYDASDGAISLSLYGDPAAIPELERILAEIPEDDDPYLRQELSNTIRDLRDTVPPQTAATADRHETAIFEDYSESAPPDYELIPVEERIAFAGAPSDIRADAIASLRNEEYSSAVRKALVEYANSDPDANVRGRAWEALTNHADDPEIRRAMLEAARTAPLDERTGAVVALASGSSIDDSVIAAIEPLYDQPGARAKALEAMWKSLDRRFQRFFPPHLHDPDPGIRRQAIVGSGYLGVESVAPELVKMFDDHDFRHDALLAYALCAPVQVSRPRVKAFLGKINQLANLDGDEVVLVEDALDQRLLMHGLQPVFSKQEEEELPPAATPKSKIGRNDPCPCGSGKKYKKCCGA